MARHALFGPFAAAIPLFALLGCGGSHDDPKPSPAPQSSTPSVAASSPAPIPLHETPPSATPPATTPVSPPDAAGPRPRNIDPRRTVATVNGKPITAEQVSSVYRMSAQMLRQRGRTLNAKDDQALRADSLEVVMADELLYQAALAKGITASAAEIDASLKQVKTRIGSPEAYDKFLADSGLTETDAYREVARNVQTEIYRKSLIEGKGVTEEQAKRFYDENVSKGIFNVPEQVHVQYILVKAGEKDPESVRIDARQRADEAAKRAAAGEDFTMLAKEYSQDATAARGGDIGLFPRGVMFPKFEELAFGGKPGDVTPVFETPKGFNVMKILEKKPESTRSYDEVKSALLVDLGRMMEQEVVRAKIQELAGRAKIVILDPAFARPAPPASASAKVPPPARP